MIHKVSKWQKNNQTLYCLSDFHLATQPHNLINNQQRSVILQAAKASDAHIIAEDSLRYFNLEPSNKQLYAAPKLRLIQLKPNEASLLGLSSLCHYADISNKNVEFRLGPTAAYNNGYAVSRVLAHAKEAVSRIANYNDGPIASTWYKKVLDEYAAFSSGSARYFLEKLQEKGEQPVSRALLESIPYSCDIQTALEELNPAFDWSKMDQYSQKLVLLMLFDNKLIDAELAHALMQSEEKKTVFICSGSEHIERLSPLLEQLEYKKIASAGDNLIAQDIRYKEPKSIGGKELSILLDAKKNKLPLLLSTSFSIQSLLDKKNAHHWVQSISYYTILLFSTMALLFLPITSRLATSYCIVLSAAFSYILNWYLFRPTRMK